MALEANFAKIATKNVPIREKNGGTQAIAGTGKADDQSNCVYRMAGTTGSQSGNR